MPELTQPETKITYADALSYIEQDLKKQVRDIGKELMECDAKGYVSMQSLDRTMTVIFALARVEDLIASERRTD